MKVPRRMKKKIKKDIKNIIGVTNEVFINESFYLSIYNKPLNRVLNSLVYLNYPTREELIQWWVNNNPKDPATQIVLNQKDLFKGLEQLEKNITIGYMKAGKTLALSTIMKK